MSLGLGFVFKKRGYYGSLGETWPEFSEFALISKKIVENKGESVWYNDKGMGSVGEVQWDFMSRSFTSYSEGIVNVRNESIWWVIYMVGLSMDGVDAQIILLMLAILFLKNFSKREHRWKFDVFGKMGRIFSSGGMSILFAILNNLRGSEEINAIFLL